MTRRGKEWSKRMNSVASNKRLQNPQHLFQNRCQGGWKRNHKFPLGGMNLQVTTEVLMKPCYRKSHVLVHSWTEKSETWAQHGVYHWHLYIQYMYTLVHVYVLSMYSIFWHTHRDKISINIQTNIGIYTYICVPNPTTRRTKIHEVVLPLRGSSFMSSNTHLIHCVYYPITC